MKDSNNPLGMLFFSILIVYYLSEDYLLRRKHRICELNEAYTRLLDEAHMNTFMNTKTISRVTGTDTAGSLLKRGDS